MPDFYNAYYVFPNGTVPHEDITVAQPTGEMVTRRTQEPRMVTRDVLDEDGIPTGETKEYQSGWIIGGEEGDETEEVERYRGGHLWIGSAEGETAMIVQSTTSVLDQIAALDDVLEVDREILNAPEAPADIQPAAAPAPASDPPEGRGRELAAGKLNEIDNALADKGMEELPEGLTVASEAVEFIFRQIEPSYVHGEQSLG